MSHTTGKSNLDNLTTALQAAKATLEKELDTIAMMKARQSATKSICAARKVDAHLQSIDLNLGRRDTAKLILPLRIEL